MMTYITQETVFLYLVERISYKPYCFWAFQLNIAYVAFVLLDKKPFDKYRKWT